MLKALGGSSLEELNDKMEAIVQGLPPDQRATVLEELKERSTKQVAGIIQLSVKSLEDQLANYKSK
jgi:DNA-directed RNA polymerase specialized sigma24 family protein